MSIVNILIKDFAFEGEILDEFRKQADEICRKYHYYTNPTSEECNRTKADLKYLVSAMNRKKLVSTCQPDKNGLFYSC